MKEYEMVINGVEHTVLMDEDEAKERGLKPTTRAASPSAKAGSAQDKARSASNK